MSGVFLPAFLYDSFWENKKCRTSNFLVSLQMNEYKKIKANTLHYQNISLKY